jgi:membrane protease YdiL (CAAX protease family)
MKPWGLWATLGFAILAFGLGQALGVAALTAVKSFDPLRIDFDGTAIAIVTLVANPVQVITLVLAARMSHSDTLEYFGLNLPRWRDVTIAIAALAAMIVVADGVTLALGREIVPAFQLEIHRSAAADGTLVWLLLAIIVVAPVGEELLFRGFLFRGLVREPRDAIPGIVAIALIWSLLHIQYDWFGATIVFVVGLLFGSVRYLSGSTTLVIALHILLNLESVMETLVVLGWL